MYHNGKVIEGVPNQYWINDLLPLAKRYEANLHHFIALSDK